MINDKKILILFSALALQNTISDIYSAEKKNVLFILTDDLGWRDLGCNGSSFYETPNIDKLAAEGMFFTHAYSAAPVSAPARGAIMSGKFPSRNGYTGLSGQWGKPSKGKLVDADFLPALPSSEMTILESFRKNGYETFHFGKWHIGDGEEHGPLNQGADKYITGFENSKWKGQRFNQNGEFITDVLTDSVISNIDKNSGKPFFMNLWYYAVHTPIKAKPKDIEYFKAKSRKMGLDTIQAFTEGEYYPALPWFKKKNQRIKRRIVQSDPVYAAFLYCLDYNIGRIVKKLKEKGLYDDTIIVFYSDNGGLSSAEGSPTCNSPLKEGKGWDCEGGLRVPLIVKVPEKTFSCCKCGSVVVGTDIYPTLLELCGLPLEKEQHVDGQSFVELLRGNDMKHNPVFWHSPHYFNNGGYPFSAVYKDGWKYIYRYDLNKEYLYNVHDDISELENKVEVETGRRNELRKLLDNYLNEVKARYPKENNNYKENMSWK